MSAEIERRVLSGLLLAAAYDDHDLVAEALAVLTPACFGRRPRRLVFESVATLAETGRPPGLGEVTNELRWRGVLSEVRGQVAGPDGCLAVATGAVFVTGLLNEVFTPALLPHETARLRSIAARREAIRLGRALVEAAESGRPLHEIAAVVGRIHAVVREAMTLP